MIIFNKKTFGRIRGFEYGKETPRTIFILPMSCFDEEWLGNNEYIDFTILKELVLRHPVGKQGDIDESRKVRYKFYKEILGRYYFELDQNLTNEK